MTNSPPSEATRITRDQTIESILALFPHKAQRLAQEITNAGLHCIGCQAATWETLEAGMKSHGKSEEEITRLLDRLNALLEEEVDLTTITLTQRAAQKYLSILEADGKQGYALRFGDKPAGCSGFEYILDYSEKALADDDVFTCHGVEIHVNRATLPRLIGSEIDYVDGLMGSGFKISNPNVSSACGCGSSHGY
jgi:iron-sulfur cluster assembly accessory protein